MEAVAAHLSSPLVHESCKDVAELVRALMASDDVLAALNDETDASLSESLVRALRTAAVCPRSSA